MPKTRQRRTAKKAALKRGKYTRADVNKINEAFDKKFLEYSIYTLDQLETIRDSRTEKGVYLQALLEVIKAKKRPKKEGTGDLLEKEKEELQTAENASNDNVEKEDVI